MNLLVCYGGSFDPVHAGHVAVARGVRDALGAEVRLLPAADPPHKDTTVASQADRARMLALAIRGEPGLALDLREYARAGPSWTVDSLQSLRDELGPRQPIAWLVGSDALPGLHRWHDWPRLFALGHVLAVERPGSSIDLPSLQADAPDVHDALRARSRDARVLAHEACGGFATVALPRLRDESSTEVRRRIGLGLPWAQLVPPSVADYIEQRALYRDGPPPAAD